MGEVYKRLAQGRLDASGGTTKLYDVPSSTEAIIKSINVSNNTASAREVTLHHTATVRALLTRTSSYLESLSRLAGLPGMKGPSVWQLLPRSMGLLPLLMLYPTPSGAWRFHNVLDIL